MKFKVIKSTESSNRGFVNTIEGESKIKVFGVEKTTKHRFLLKTDVQLAVGAEDEIPLSEFNQVPFTSELPDGTPITMTWLHKKAS